MLSLDFKTSDHVTSYGITAGHVTEIEDQRDPRVSQAILKTKILPQSEDSRLTEESLVVVLECICEAHLSLVSC